LIRLGVGLAVIDHQSHRDVAGIVEGVADVHAAIVLPFYGPAVGQWIVVRIERAAATEIERRAYRGRGGPADHRGGRAIGGQVAGLCRCPGRGGVALAAFVAQGSCDGAMPAGQGVASARGAVQSADQIVWKGGDKIQPRTARDMATVAGVRGGWMSTALARGNGAVMAVAAQIKGLGMGERRHQIVPNLAYAMAGITLIGRQGMVAGFAGGQAVVVASDAGGGADLPVIERIG
jgi:hypothetical protein